jgi:hypothetical protein
MRHIIAASIATLATTVYCKANINSLWYTGLSHIQRCPHFFGQLCHILIWTLRNLSLDICGWRGQGKKQRPTFPMGCHPGDRRKG